MFTSIDIQGNKYEPTENARGKDLLCPCCRTPVILKKGKINIPHFAHVNKNCGYFDYKGMSKWHKDWQGLFPPFQREVRMQHNFTKEIHIADIVNSNGIVLEFQHSPISVEEKQSRDNFYPKLIWIIDGSKIKGEIEVKKVYTDEYSKYLNFKHNSKSHVLKMLSGLEDIVDGMNKIKRLYDCGIIQEDPVSFHQKRTIENVLNNLKKSVLPFKGDKYKKYLKCVWKYPHKAYVNSPTWIFIDNGDGTMLRIPPNQENNADVGYEFIAAKMSKDFFIAKYCQHGFVSDILEKSQCETNEEIKVQKEVIINKSDKTKASNRKTVKLSIGELHKLEQRNA